MHGSGRRQGRGHGHGGNGRNRCRPIGRLIPLNRNHKGFKLFLRFEREEAPDECQVKSTDDRCEVKERRAVWKSQKRYTSLACTLIPYLEGEALDELEFDATGRPVADEPPVEEPPVNGELTPNPTVQVSAFAGVVASGSVTFAWTSAAEPNVEIYVIRRKGPGEADYMDVVGADPQGPGASYSVLETPPGAGSYSYLLCAMLFDGTVEKLAIRSVTI